MLTSVFGLCGRGLIVAAAGLLLSMAGSLEAQAVPFTVDTKIGEALLGNSSEAAELQALADAAGVDVNSLTLVSKVESGFTLFSNDVGSWYLDVDPAAPSFFALKFGIGGLSVTADTFFFMNIAELTKLVFSDAQVQNITGDCQGCDEFRLSHYTLVNAIPIPAALPLLLSALGILGLLRMRKKSISAAA